MSAFVPFDWTASYLAGSPEDRTAILQRLLDAQMDASALSTFKDSPAYKLFKEFIDDQTARIQEAMFSVIDATPATLSSGEKRDLVFSYACALKSYRDLLAFIDNTIEFGKIADIQSETLNTLKPSLPDNV